MICLAYLLTIICSKILIFLIFYESVTNRRTDGRTDRQTDRPSYRNARTHLKTPLYTGIHLEFVFIDVTDVSDAIVRDTARLSSIIKLSSKDLNRTVE